MKKLNKLQINSEKIINNEELLALRGGYGTCTCMCWRGGGVNLGYLVTQDIFCHEACVYAWEPPYDDVTGYPVTSGCW
jgi:natural product precursor